MATKTKTKSFRGNRRSKTFSKPSTPAKKLDEWDLIAESSEVIDLARLSLLPTPLRRLQMIALGYFWICDIRYPFFSKNNPLPSKDIMGILGDGGGLYQFEVLAIRDDFADFRLVHAFSDALTYMPLGDAKVGDVLTVDQLAEAMLASKHCHRKEELNYEATYGKEVSPPELEQLFAQQAVLRTALIERKREILGNKGVRLGIRNMSALLQDPVFISLRNGMHQIALRMTKLPKYNEIFNKPDII